MLSGLIVATVTFEALSVRQEVSLTRLPAAASQKLRMIAESLQSGPRPMTFTYEGSSRRALRREETGPSGRQTIEMKVSWSSLIVTLSHPGNILVKSVTKLHRAVT